MLLGVMLMILKSVASYEEVRERYNREKNGKIKERLLIILKAFKIKSSYQIAENVLTSHTKVQRWVRRFNKYGFEGLKDKPKSGRPSKLKKHHKKELQELLDQPKEFSVGWRTLEVLDKIHKNFNVQYSQRHVRRLLYQLGYSRVKPRPVHVKKDPIKAKEVVDNLKKNSYVWTKNGLYLQGMNSA